jgi:hypothetical protein
MYDDKYQIIWAKDAHERLLKKKQGLLADVHNLITGRKPE